MSDLHYDGRGTTAEAIGDYGIEPADRERITAALKAARDAVVAAWESGELGFLGCPDIDVSPFIEGAHKITSDDRFTDQVVIGIGGSSLGARAVLGSVSEELDGLRTHFSENMDPVRFGQLLDSLNLERTLFVVITKSGSTIETMSKFWFVWERMQEVAGEHASKHFVAITDPERGYLRPMARELGFETFSVPPNVGGRFSVLTAVGLVPLALAGYPVQQLMEGARNARDNALNEPVGRNALLRASQDHFLLRELGMTQTVMMAYSEQLYPLAEWFCQLWGESLGKAKTRSGETVETGLTPIRALGVIDQHSQIQLYAEGPRDKHVVFLEVEQFDRDITIPEAAGLPESIQHLGGKSMQEIMSAELRGTRAALLQAGRPTSTWSFGRVTPAAVGSFILSWEFVTAVVGELLDIDAFNQPGVELGKKIAHGLLGRDGFDEYAALAGEQGDSDTLTVS